MRTALTLDQDVVAKLKTEAQRSGRPFREIVNDMRRRGLESQRVSPRRDLGNLRPRVALDNIARPIEDIEGSLHPAIPKNPD